jgi:RHS repeat-associated protein
MTPGQGGGGHPQGASKLTPKERSAPLPASESAAPPHPLVSPTGNVAVDALGSLVNRAAEPWQALPTQTPVQEVATVVNGVLGILNMDVAVDAFNMGVGAISSVVPWPSLPAAVLGMPHIGTPHTHLHPPSLVPPAPPIPLPSIGTVAMSGCVSVLIGGIPAARAGDLGLALTCGTLAPPFEIAFGSSSVFIGGARAARMGDMTKHCSPPPPPGAGADGSLSVPDPPKFDAVGAGFGAAVGLLNVAAASSPLAMAMAAAQMAADAAKTAIAALMGTDPGAPPCVGAVMMGNPNVLIGGFPIPPVENHARAFFQKLTKPLARVLHGIVGKALGKGRLANFFHELVCHTTGHPVDVATGRLLTSAVDLQLPGPLPLVFKRQYATSWSFRDGVLGWGWSHSFDQAVWVESGRDDGKPEGQDHQKVVYRAEDGREIEFASPDAAVARPAWLSPSERWDRFNRLTLRPLGPRGNAGWEIESSDGLTREFQIVGGGAAAQAGRRDLTRLTRIRDRAGNAIALRYDRGGNLDTIVDSGGREIRLESDAVGRLKRIMVPHPAGGGWVEHARYVYSPSGDLVEVYDALGKAARMAYETHLMVRETNRNDLSFYFEYEGSAEAARCVKTWGDGDIYFRKIFYDVQNHVTISTDSYGHATTYRMNADNAVVSVSDALGGTTSYTFDDSYRKVGETDAMGAETRWEFDGRGNCTKVIAPDGAEVKIEYNDRDQAVFAVDPVKGEWHWGYDGHGQLTARVDPLDRRVRFVWAPDDSAKFANAPASAPAGSRGAERAGSRARGSAAPLRLVAVIDPAGQTTALTYDAQGNVTSLRSPNGAESRWKYDRLGRCIAAIDPKGNTQAREHDALGRVVRVREPDGNVRELEFDAEGNVVHARDQQHDVRFTYQGMGRLRSRAEAGTTVTFEYDREERLVGITNEHGHVYRFELGPTGQVVTESGFDGVTRVYKRDLGGRVKRVVRPARRSTDYAYDAGGRVVAVEHSDGTAEAYAYRADGALLQAKNDAGLVTFERDTLGRVLKELTGDDWVASEYDILGMRVGLQSSKGLRQRIERNGMGDVLGVRARIADGEAADHEGGASPGRPSGPTAGAAAGSPADGMWEARFERDTVGLELERVLPGGVKARWERDNLGRPKKHSIWAGGLAKGAWRYSWEVNDRLRKVVDLLAGPTQYQHDALGNLASAAYADGHIDLRMPDAVGNLFRTKERTDRKYGPAGQLLESRDPDGSLTRYTYDPEGNLIQKARWDAGSAKRLPPESPTRKDTVETTVPRNIGEPLASEVWTYEWNGAGMLSKVIRPDGAPVEFTYDALGRRLSKSYGNRKTHWIWDGNLPLHEWVELQAAQPGEAPPPLPIAVTDEITARQRRANLNEQPAQGPPPPGSPAASPLALATPSDHASTASRASTISTSAATLTALAAEPGTAESPITWLFEPESFAPLAKLVGTSRYGIVTDHLGTPQSMFDATGAEVWSASIDAYGDLRNLKGTRQSCPFRFPGQYEDEETGLYYNRFRYYDPLGGEYTKQDPLSLEGGFNLHAYVPDPLVWIDPLGLSCGAAAEAEAWQGKGDYPGVDKWRNVILKKGTIIYGGFPGPTAFHTTEGGMRRSGGTKEGMWKGLQVMPDREYGPRPEMRVYVVTEDTPAAMALTRANGDWGEGGLPQLYVPAYKTALEPMRTVPLK